MNDKLELERIETLRKYEILDTPADDSFNTMTAMAAKIFNVPVAIVSLVDEDRIWFKSQVGLNVQEITKDPGLCVSAIVSNDIYVVENAKTDPRTLSNPLVAGEFGLQFYAAAPLITKDGYKLGTFCIIDKKQRFFSEDHQAVLKGFAKLTMQLMDIKLEARTLVKDTLTLKP